MTKRRIWVAGHSGMVGSATGLAESVGRATGFLGQIVLDTTKLDGAPRKLMDSSKIRALGWKPEIALDDGIAGAYRWFLEKNAGGTNYRQGAMVA